MLHFDARLRALFLAVSGSLLTLSVGAQVQISAPVNPGERLSDWLLRNSRPDADFTSLHWRVPSERASQELLRRAVNGRLDADSALTRFLGRLPVTGRLSLAHHDARWMQGSAQDDPVMALGQELFLLRRPTQVAVLNEAADICLLPHRSGWFTRDYLLACSLGSENRAADGSVDWAWIAQPDGRTTRMGVAAWSEQQQDEPAPGAWIWAPARSAQISDASSGNLARLLATQFPAEVLLPDLGVSFRTPGNLSEPGYGSAPTHDLALTAGDWGEIGLLQTPTARMEKSGEVRLNISAGWPYTRVNVMLQPTDWLEAGFRYTDITNQLYGPSIAGGQTYKDKSLDLKLRVAQEGAHMPQLAIGLRDIGGTGLFSGEYLVASKRWGNWDASAGLGWGYLGARANIGAPLGFLGDRFKVRSAPDVGQGGVVSTNDMFHGNAAAFGGVQWQSPFAGLILKAELDGNDYRSEPFGSNLNASSPVNFGVVYRYSPHVDISASWERGERLGFALTLHAALDKLEAPKVLDAALPRVQSLTPPQDTAREISPQSWHAAAQTLGQYTGWRILELDPQFSTLTVRAETDDALFVQERLQRAIRVLHKLAPGGLKHFVFLLESRGVALSRIEVDRTEWLTQQTQPVAPSMKLPTQQLYPGTTQAALQSRLPVYQVPKDTGFSAEWGPSYSQILGGPDGFLLYELGLQAKLEQRFTSNTWLNANFNARLLDNYQGFKYDAPSDLPRVRTYAREYVTGARATMPLLQLTHMQDMGRGHYTSVYGGMLEDMYGGVGGEWLYRPWQSKLAIGVDVNRVRQRDFLQNLSFRDYTVNTGHATLYWDTAWNDLQVKLSAGRYLAGDTGFTLDMKRVFANGTAIGAWATKTNVSAQQFGEGSFDKGVYVNIPFDVMLPKSAPGLANLVWNPLTRDGGARLNRSFSLFDFTRQRDARTWSLSSQPVSLHSRPASAEDNAFVEPESSPDLWSYAGTTTAGLGHGIAAVPASTWGRGAAWVLGASLLDNTLDLWAKSHQGGDWDRAATLADSLPYALALGTGVLFTGIAGDDAASTAKTSLTAAAYTVGGNFLTKFAVGRARPADDLGSTSFHGFTHSAAQSSFGSNHVALAFALATPFAQQYDKPWLYALAAASGWGRVQSRAHWFSDTVVGGLMGYAIGSITYDVQHGAKRNVRLSATPQSVNANWSF
jgi:membrane-associated phospholipid phosphatase